MRSVSQRLQPLQRTLQPGNCDPGLQPTVGLEPELLAYLSEGVAGLTQPSLLHEVRA